MSKCCFFHRTLQNESHKQSLRKKVLTLKYEEVETAVRATIDNERERTVRIPSQKGVKHPSEE